ncbi:hypothetical protein L810_3718 [Burkholderia sp. AU4i]|nr:hypothetical protein L810_3718 [Burkholderia sp. AU4i]MDW9242938.1 hypothetical protein [Burkholderia cepacia]QOH34189.1 hypothetical protein C7S14_5536 [Burkholderia cepacia]
MNHEAAAFGRAKGGVRAVKRASGRHADTLEIIGIALFLKHRAIILGVLPFDSRRFAMDCSEIGTMR